LTVIEADRPNHTRLRKAFGPGFTAFRIASLRPRIETLVDGLLDRGLQQGCIELMEQLAIPLPLLITAEMLGMDPDAVPMLKVWAASELSGIYPGSSVEHREELIRTSHAILDHFRRAIERERSRDKRSDNLVGELVESSAEAQLTGDELTAFLALMIRAGSYTVI